ncbi:MAG: helix-turn-helix domain-containing protein [Sphingomonadaceae bacterium]
MQGCTLAEVVKRERKKRGWSTRQLGEKAGVSHSTISRIESGERVDIAVETLRRIAGALGMKPEELLASAEMAGPLPEDRTFGARLRSARMRRKLTVDQLAARVRVSPEYIADLESDRTHEFTPEVLRDLAKALGVDIWEMLIAAGIIESYPEFRDYARQKYDVRAEDEDIITTIEVLLRRLREKDADRRRREQSEGSGGEGPAE